MLAVTSVGLTSFDPCVAGFFADISSYVLIFMGFSLVVFFHELGHFLAAKACGVRIDKFAVGFGRSLLSYRKGIGVVAGPTEEPLRRKVMRYIEEKRSREIQLQEKLAPTDSEIAAARRELGIGETEYCFNILPLGGYVKMLGQEDFAVDKSGELRVKDDPRAFTHKPVGQRMIIVSAGVVMNLLFAAFVFMLVFMIGIEFPPAVVGMMEMESPAERAGLRHGDHILQINNQEISDFNDVLPAVLLSAPNETLRILVSRPDPGGGEPTQHTIDVQPERYRDESKLQIGVAPPMNSTVAIALPDPALPKEAQLERGDRIVSINGTAVSTLPEIIEELVRARGTWTQVEVERPSAPENPEKSESTRHTVRRRASLAFRPTGDPYKESGHLLGLIPRREISMVNPGEPADRAGFRSGDVIVRWGNQAAPTLEEVIESIRSNPNRDLRVVVRRPSAGGEDTEHSFEVRPRVPGWFSSGTPKVGMDPFGQESDRLVVADIATRIGENQPTPAAELKGRMPRGSLITKLNDEPVATWSELAQRLTRLAGSRVKLTWSYEGQPEESGEIYVPHTLGTTFDLPPEKRITKIAGKAHVDVSVDGKRKRFAVGNWRGAREVLSDNVGQTVEVEYRGILDEAPTVVKVQVTPEMLDTWVQRVEYQVADLITEMVLTNVQVSNPVKAMKIGVMKTYYFIDQVYRMMQRMIISRSVSTDQISGPVGIVKMGSDIARQDFTRLMYFLALISANLAVINFLPLPIVDGGLFVFLLIEKIKGRPISLRVQVATQIIGLVLIIGIFLYVTIQDVQKMFG